MNDRWGRPDDRPTAIEVPLLDLAGQPVDADGASTPPPTNWRLVVGLAAIGGVVAGLIVSAILLSSDGGDDTPPTTTLAPDTLAALITTPATFPGSGPPGELDDMNGVSSQDRVLFDPVPSITAPVYPTLDLPDEVLDRYDLDAALTRLDDDVSRRATTHYEIGEGGFTIDVTVARDATRDRYSVVIEGDPGTFRLILDRSTATVYLSQVAEPWPDGWQIAAESDFSGSQGTLATVLRRLLLGPVRSDTVGEAILVTPGSVVTFGGDVPPARRFGVTLRAGQVPEWARYQLGAVADAPPPDDDEPIAFVAYVSEADDIVEVSGVFPYGNTKQLVVHRLETLDDVEIALPDVAADSSSTTTAP